jgi:hypothetical protein
MLVLMLACAQDGALVVFDKSDTAAPDAENQPPQVVWLTLGEAPDTDGVIQPIVEVTDPDGDAVMPGRWHGPGDARHGAGHHRREPDPQ